MGTRKRRHLVVTFVQESFCYEFEDCVNLCCFFLMLRREIAMSTNEKNYQLRPKRARKGKYREMIGISSEPYRSDADNEINNTKNEDDEENCNVYILPIVVSGPGENQVIATIEINDPDNVMIPDLDGTRPARMKSEIDCIEDRKKSDPLDRIEEILEKNDRLMDSILEGPTFKKRRKLHEVHNEDASESHSVDDGKSDWSDGVKTKLKSNDLTISHPVDLTMELIEEKMIRPLTDVERVKVEELLDGDEQKAVIEMLFGSSSENRVRKCFICSCLIEGSDSVYASHYSEVHQSEASFVCEFCGEVNAASSLHHLHVDTHFKPRSKSTRTDNNIFDKSDSSEEFHESKETLSEAFVCDICGKTLKHQKSLYSHRRTHTDAKAVCHICGATLKSSRYLHHHLLLHKDIDKPHKCDKCGKAFHSSSALKVHHYYNHEEHPGRFQCTICSKTFKAKQGLQFHMDSHSNELRYECSLCHKRFRGFKTCRVHELRHREAAEPNKFSCPICGKFFKTRQTLKVNSNLQFSMT